MTKSNFAPSTSRSTDPKHRSQDDRAPLNAAAEDENEDTKLSDSENGGGASGTQGTGSAG